MKSLYILTYTLTIFCSFTFFGQAQNSRAQLFFDELTYIDHIGIRMIEIIDSRCPKQVNCIRAGEATVIVELYKNDIFIKEVEIEFPASGAVNVNKNTFFNVGGFKISGVGLFPYPQGVDKIPLEQYVLDVVFN